MFAISSAPLAEMKGHDSCVHCEMHHLAMYSGKEESLQPETYASLHDHDHASRKVILGESHAKLINPEPRATYGNSDENIDSTISTDGGCDETTQLSVAWMSSLSEFQQG